MSNARSAISDSWRALRRARPGERFLQHYRRAQRERSPARTALRLVLGAGLTAGGVALWFLPGPGWLLVTFGMAMFASESRWLAKSLDRFEVLLRTSARRLRG